MKMDILPWIQLNLNVKIRNTSKKFYDQYLYKAEVFVPAGIMINSEGDMSKLLERRIAAMSYNFLSYNFGGSWKTRLNEEVKNRGRVEQLEYYRELKCKHSKLELKYRIEEPTLSLYSNDEQLLYDIVTKDPCPGRFRSIFRPANDDALEKLSRGEIIVKTPTVYNFKVLLSDKGISLEQRIQIYNYLSSLGDEVRITDGCKEALHRSRYYNNIYFFIKDESILLFLKIIAPDAISKIYSLTN